MRHWPRKHSEAPVTLLCVHGLMEHSGRYERLAAALCAAGADVLCVDLVGHGQSPGRRGHVTDFVDDHLGAVDAMIAAAKASGADGSCFLLGHSLGGLIAARWAQARGTEAGIASLILMTPFVEARMRIPAWKRSLAIALSTRLPGFTLPTGIRDLDLFRDPVERESFAADPWVQRRISAGHWVALEAEQRRLVDQAGSLTMPTLLLLAGEDRIVSTAASRALGRALPDVTVVEYPEAFHVLHADPISGQVFKDLIEWIRRQLD